DESRLSRLFVFIGGSKANLSGDATFDWRGWRHRRFSFSVGVADANGGYSPWGK
ncbi:unnamed protein product, partial [marine sediment metagenome]